MTVRDQIKTRWNQRPAARRRRAAVARFDAEGLWPRSRLSVVAEKIGDALGEVWTAVWRRGR